MLGLIQGGTCASPTTTIATYAYDAQGRRKSKTVNGATTIYVTDADNREVLEYDGATGAILNWYAYGFGPNDVLNQMNVAAGTRATLIPDVQGSIIGTVDSGAGTLTKTGYQPYGESSVTTGSFRYTAQRIDPETNGLYYYRARMYAPAWGRFMQADPSGYAAGANLYAYVDNDPLNRTDPFGLCDSPQGCGGAGGASITEPGIVPVYPIETAIGIVAGGPSLARLGLSLLRAAAGEFLQSELPVSTGASPNVQNSAPNFVVSSEGTVFPVPEGAQGPSPVMNPSGTQTGVTFTGGSGGTNGQVSTMRIMNPTSPRGNSPGYPNGYIVYQNNASPTAQAVNPYTGQTVPRSLAHFPIQ